MGAESSTTSQGATTFLIVDSPNLPRIGAGKDVAIVMKGHHKIFIPCLCGYAGEITLGPVSHAIRFIVEGTKDCMVLRTTDDECLSLEVNFRAMNVGDPLGLWSFFGGKSSPCTFCLNSDLTISPRKGSSVCSNVAIGVNSSNRSRLQLVNRYDKKNRITWRNW